MKMDLQLYKADKKHYLLDFKHLPTRESDRLHTLLPDSSTVDGVTSPTGTDAGRSSPASSASGSGSSLHTLEFFELCAMVISELGR